MAAVKGIYGVGKTSALSSTTNVSHSAGKRSSLASRTNVSASAGKNSGAARGGDPKGCAPMGGKGGKSC